MRQKILSHFSAQDAKPNDSCDITALSVPAARETNVRFAGPTTNFGLTALAAAIFIVLVVTIMVHTTTMVCIIVIIAGLFVSTTRIRDENLVIHLVRHRMVVMAAMKNWMTTRQFNICRMYAATIHEPNELSRSCLLASATWL